MAAFTPLGEYMVHNSDVVDIDLNCSTGGKNALNLNREIGYIHSGLHFLSCLLSFRKYFMGAGRNKEYT